MSQNAKVRILPGSWILEQLTLRLSDVERSAGRRAWREAQQAWLGEEEDLWWRWAAEAATSIGLATKVIDCSVSEAVELINNGAEIICWKKTDVTDDTCGCWLRVSDVGHHRFEVNEASTFADSTVASLGKVRRVLQGYVVSERIRCVVVRPDISFGSHQTHGMQPLARLIELLKPEWPDIWIVLVFAFVVGLLMLATPIAVEALVNTVAFGRFLQPVVVLALILLTFLLFSAAMRALQTYVVELIQRRLFARVAGDLAYRLPRAQTEATDGIYLPELANRFFDIVTVQKVAAQLLLDGVGLVLTALIGMAVLAFYHPWLLGFDVVMMSAIAFVILVLGQGAVSSAVKESKHKYRMAAWLEDIGRCPTAFRTDGGADLALERTDRLVHQYLEARQKHFRILMRQILFALGLQAVASTVLLGLGGWLVIVGQLTLGQLVAAELIVTVIVGAFAKLGKHMESFYDLLAAVDKLGALFDIPTEHHDGVLESSTEMAAAVRLSGVAYIGSGERTLTMPVTVSVAPSSSLAIFGAAGSGKSTLIDILCGLRTPSSGLVTMDDIDPQDLRPDVLRQQVAVVRRGEVFHGTLEENIHLHRENVATSDVRSALESAGLYKTALALTDGLHTHLDGTGAPLSTSQCDLLCLARAIAGGPRLLLIDGLLDGLADEELEHVITSLLYHHSSTVIIATGRRTIAERCDQQLRLEKSKQQLPDIQDVNA